jgi:hypothetical protein
MPFYKNLSLQCAPLDSLFGAALPEGEMAIAAGSSLLPATLLSYTAWDSRYPPGCTEEWNLKLAGGMHLAAPNPRRQDPPRRRREPASMRSPAPLQPPLRRPLRLAQHLPGPPSRPARSPGHAGTWNRPSPWQRPLPIRQAPLLMQRPEKPTKATNQ